ncbi:MAG: type II secretion system protein N [Thiobacillaceae bacterium]
MKRLLKAVLLLLLLVLTYLVMLPATWMDALLQRASQGTLAMTGTTGTFWRGEGSLQALLPSGAAVTLVPVSWNIAAGELLALRLHINALSTRDKTPVLNATFGFGETYIQEAKMDLPAELLGVLSPTLRAAALSGQLALQAKDVRFDSSHAAGKMLAYWKAAGSSLSRVRPLGNYLLDLTGQGNGMDFHLTTIGGQLNLTGSGSWRPGTRPDIKVMAKPQESARQDLAPLLRMIGREVSPGTYQLSLDPNVQAITR